MRQRGKKFTAARAQIAADRTYTIEDAVPLRRCGARIGRKAALECGPPCVPAQLGVATCPCRSQLSEESYAELAFPGGGAWRR